MKIVSSNNRLLEASYSQLSTRFDSGSGVLWTFMDQESVPCFTKELLEDFQQHHKDIERSGGSLLADGGMQEIRYSVLASLTPGVFNLGGQLALFRQLISNKDRETLLHYATKCIDAFMTRLNHFNLPLATISLIQGDALGGGFEAALASDIIIAERSSQMGFPEILFNLFPGMGAYSLVARKVGTRIAEKLILSGKIYSAEELHAMGVVDFIAEDGEGEQAVHDWVKKQERRSIGFIAVQKARHRFNPISYQELMDITTIWVDSALKLSERDLKVMERFVRAQERMVAQQSEMRSRNIA
ncbi:crotonase/enoyl-CoA hydratase family protein [Propionivibrio sp.]|uniref:crotonase/enoyl-CoA hydratase family protein n=1 Tax=Propionivibrio sp. TaxID=2212460 RepID=UPI002634D797|nr:crotonase/enoyl-CoA hydratase family protein [Propionivibrio sp.]